MDNEVIDEKRRRVSDINRVKRKESKESLNYPGKRIKSHSTSIISAHNSVLDPVVKKNEWFGKIDNKTEDMENLVPLDLNTCDYPFAELQSPSSSPYYQIHIPNQDHVFLAYCSSIILDTAKSSINYNSTEKPFRLEFHPQNNLLRLKIDPIYWYDHILDKNEKVKTASKWVKSIQEQSFIENQTVNEKMRSKVAMKTLLECIHTPERKDTGAKQCGLKIYQSLLVHQGEIDKRFVMQLRPKEKTREILFVVSPKTKDQIEWKGHFDNDFIVRCPGTWKYVLDILKVFRIDTKLDFPFECIAFNFGKWETGISNDLMNLECHGHGHFILSSDCHEKFSIANRFDGFFKGRKYPVDYDEKDSRNLSKKRLLVDKVDSVSERLDTFEEKLDQKLEEKFDQKLEEKFQKYLGKKNNDDSDVNGANPDLKYKNSGIFAWVRNSLGWNYK